MIDNISIFRFGFLDLVKVSRTYKDFAVELRRDIPCNLLALLCFILLGAAPIPYVQAAILDLPHI